MKTSVTKIPIGIEIAKTSFPTVYSIGTNILRFSVSFFDSSKYHFVFRIGGI